MTQAPNNDELRALEEELERDDTELPFLSSSKPAVAAVSSGLYPRLGVVIDNHDDESTAQSTTEAPDNTAPPPDPPPDPDIELTSGELRELEAMEVMVANSDTNLNDMMQQFKIDMTAEAKELKQLADAAAAAQTTTQQQQQQS